MSYVYQKVADLDHHDLVGNHQCVALIQAFTNAPLTRFWRQGATVRGQWLLAKGTAIATFADGAYKSRPHRNHAALYLSQDQGGIWVMDQWAGDPRKTSVSHRYLRFQGIGQDGQWLNTSDNGDAYSVIE